MDIRSILKNKEKEAYRGMSAGKKLEYAIELSEFVQKLSRSVKIYGKRVQGTRKSLKRS